MKTLIIGAHGKVGQLLLPKLVDAGHEVRGLVRDPAQKPAIAGKGIEVVARNLEEEFEDALESCDGVVFTAGSGGHTGADKTMLIDLWAALESMRAAERSGANRFVMVSALKADDPRNWPVEKRHYLIAKKVADDFLTRSALEFTILRPGRLVDDAGTGKVQAGNRLEDRTGTIAREDVASAIATCFELPETIGQTIEILSGNTPVRDALQNACR